MPEYLMIISGEPTLSLVIWFFVSIFILYLARIPAHMIIRSLFNALYSGFRMISRALLAMAYGVAARNRAVLIEAGREAAERRLEREFMRMDTALKRDLGNYPTLHRELQEKINLLETDYKEATEEQPPNIEGWEKAIQAVSKIPSKGSTMVADVLDNINDSFNDTHKDLVNEYQKVNKERHKILGRMIPTVRTIQKLMEQVDKNIREMSNRAREVGKYMDDFKEMLARSDKAESMLSSSALHQFVISGLVMGIAIGGAIVNFALIEGPMREMVSGDQYIYGIPMSNIAAFVIIMIEIAMGLFLMELLGVTRMFPGISSVDDKMRKRLMWTAFIILLTLALIEMSLGYSRHAISELKTTTDPTADKVALDGMLSLIPRLGQMVMGFILPFALVFIAIPMEAFVHALLIILRTLSVTLIKFLAFTVRLIALLFKHLGTIMVTVYDLVIIVPLWLESLILRRGVYETKPSKSKKKASATR
ncbi:hypothetical protein MNBD_GAMMA12-3432 [hydrothermal vent metagenome]|uniref:Uncharacterized protein n=1 Tax=hydrothermal vent metagenome TaxID=652676 RepID=A0A3B0YJK0_9ZZZZ